MPALNYQNVNLSPTISLMQVPSRWVLVPFWSLYKRRNLVALAPESEELLSVYRDYGVVRRAGRKDNFNKPSEDLSKYQLVQPGDLVINKMKAWQGSLGVSEFRGLVSPAYFVYQPVHAASHSFLHHLFRSDVYAAAYGALSKGIRVNQWDLDPHEHSRLQVLLPPLAEQHQIASFLNHETSRIDALIAEKQRLIELLQEKRQAVITQAVTKGLDPSVPMKDSGVEWLGHVPSHWQLKPLKYVVSVDNSGHFGSDEPSSQAVVGLKTCTTAHISSDGHFQFEAMDVRYFTHEQALRYRGQTGDLFVVKSSGSNTNIISGKLARIKAGDEPVVFTNFLMRLRPHLKAVNPTFLENFLQSSITRRRIERMVATTTYPNLNVHQYVSAYVPLPPLEEQYAIAEHLSHMTRRFDALMLKASTAVRLLQERRSALISAAVTGKIDIRNWQPPAADSASDSAGELVHG